MVTCRCDRCGRQVKAISMFMPFQIPAISEEPKKFYGFISDGKEQRMIDLCPECADAVYDVILNYQREESGPNYLTQRKDDE